MKQFLSKRQLLYMVIRLSNALCLLPVCITGFVMVSTLLRLIVDTTNYSFWRMVIITGRISVFISLLLSGVEYFLIRSHLGNNIILGNRWISKYLRTGRINTLAHLLVLTYLIFLSYAQFTIWHSDGHGLYGTWLYFAGVAPSELSILSTLPLLAQVKVKKKIIEILG